MKNFKITAKEDNKEYWISRAVAVVAITYTKINGEIVYLMERRGPGCPDNIGKLCFPCGYLDWDESLVDAVIRETKEELGLKLLSANVKFWKIIDDPKADARQNVCVRYMVYLDSEYLKSILPDLQSKLSNTEERGGEAEEVSEIVILPERDVEKYKDDEFAFNHLQIISELSLNKNLLEL